MKDCLGNTLVVGDRVATAMVSRYAGAGLELATVVGPSSDSRSTLIQMEASQRVVGRYPRSLVKVVA